MAMIPMGMMLGDRFNIGPTDGGMTTGGMTTGSGGWGALPGFQGWNPPTGHPYGPWSAPGYGTSMDPENAGFNLFADARSWLASNPQIFSPYQGDMTAGLTPDQMAARQQLGGFLGPNQATTDAMGIAESVGGYSPANAQYAGNVSGGSFTSGDLGAYMNPFTSNVVDMSMQDLERQRQIANQAGARSASASTYGGDRNALIEAETNRGFADAMARTSAQLRSQGFDTAAGLMGQDLNRGLTAGLANQSQRNQMSMYNAGLGLEGAGLRLDAANVLGGLGGQQFNQGLAGASALNQFGTQEQATNQTDLTNRYNDYLRSVYGPMEGYNFLGGLLSGNGYATPGGPSAGSSVLGGALSGAAIGSTFGVPGALIGGALGGLGGWLF